MEAYLLLGEGRNKLALKLFKKVAREAGEQNNLYLRIANTYLRLNQLDDAEEAILKELKNNSEEVSAHYTLGLIYFNKTQYEDALNSFMDTIGLLYFYPAAHFYIGESLYSIGEYEKAVEAYDVCLKLSPGMNRARQRIISIFETRLNLPGKSLKYKVNFDKKIKGSITIVSGLPRSGTSLMMQMLETSDLEIFTDKERTPDDNNPKGYYEHEVVKLLQTNKRWIPKANKEVVKVIAQLLKHLPMNFRYQVIFMQRNLHEVIQSQQEMLIRNGKKIKTDVLPLQLLESYNKTLKEVNDWADKQPNVNIKYVQYADVINNPFMESMKINDFLEGVLKPEKMVSAVDQNLYRMRRTKNSNLTK
ncbi:MAG: tetratricopeptide (TPR) repeat protein [Saprospiraceae bacterium]